MGSKLPDIIITDAPSQARNLSVPSNPPTPKSPYLSPAMCLLSFATNSAIKCLEGLWARRTALIDELDEISQFSPSTQEGYARTGEWHYLQAELSKVEKEYDELRGVYGALACLQMGRNLTELGQDPTEEAPEGPIDSLMEDLKIE